MLRLENLCYDLFLFFYLTNDEAESTILVSFFFLCGICTSITFLSLMIFSFFIMFREHVLGICLLEMIVSEMAVKLML
jgi:hypothetical protein